MADKKKPAAKTAKTERKETELTRVRGMRDIGGDDYYYFQGFFERAQEVAIYYGFKPLETPMLEKEEVFTLGVGAGTDIVEKEMYTLRTKGGDRLALRPEHTAPLMRAYIENGMQSEPQPVMLYQYGPVFRHDSPQKGRYRQFWQFDMDAIGSEKSILDALVIKGAMTILEEAGAPNLSIEINSIGDKECRGAYIRDLVNYYKKRIGALPPIDRERLKSNPLRILDSKEEKTKEINENAPDMLSYLCPLCKKHFKEVLEYLEEANIPYTINKCLVRGLSYYTRTVFEVIEQGSEEGAKPIAIAGGGRYDYLGRELGAKKDIPAVGVSIGVDRILEAPWWKKLTPRIIKKPKIFFLQLGLDAKMKSLGVIEILRKAHIPIYQSLSKETLASQLSVAEKLGIPYTIIFGQKEAIDGTVIVKDMKKFRQETVKHKDLAAYLKNLP